MKLLELFSGTGSVGKVFKESGWTIVSLDRDMDADIKTDIMDWTIKLRTSLAPSTCSGPARPALNTALQRR